MPVLTLILVGLLFALPLLAALLAALWPALSGAALSALITDPQFASALCATLISALLGSAAALGGALLIARSLYHSRLWLRLSALFSPMLALPHAAFAIGLVFLIAPGGMLVRLFAAIAGFPVDAPDWVTVNDPLGLALALALCLKEMPFLLWNIALFLARRELAHQTQVAASLGYAPKHIWRWIILPQLLPRLAWPLCAVLAYSLTVIDMAIIAGPGTPPTLAVLLWQWLQEGDPARLAPAMAGSWLLALLSGALLMLFALLWRAWQASHRWPDGQRGQRTTGFGGRLLAISLLAIYGAVILLTLLWSFAGLWLFPEPWPQSLTLAAWQDGGDTLAAHLFSTLALALLSGSAALLLALLWLEYGTEHPAVGSLLLAPLILPQVLLVAGLYRLALPWQLEGSVFSVAWAQLFWVFPYMVIVLAPAYRRFDARYLMLARALGHTRLKACWRVKWPMLARPIAAAAAVGVAVSIAQYLPTLYLGAGRITTLTTEAVALSSGGNRRVMAAYALLTTLLPLIAFMLARTLPDDEKHSV
ncbi:ABC transporter permease [Craterilacuibacter sinensis]|uniref:ABC transporter permease subunit n=1 Tax=Craterilacuibacter sinensis TaxID=2686017 RepID=A0A845BPJ8_9NEIS|nr:ABC transporter permease subunit [Craterilacuibacter sinensis]MXR37098.1 ABC transporter permease subunit [Craterilacuibacter sinensis]